MNLLVDKALGADIDAIHPGYGYLSENADFANAVRQAGIIFIGPSAKAMSTLGDKRTAKDYLRQNEPNVPLIPGFSGSSQDADELQAVAQEIGFPVMLKASAGGGGKGMRIVREASQLQEELTRARSEAARSFGSEDCILEKYIEAGKHIEIQIVGDSYGNVVSLWERECSIQRRHQKVIEETPSPWMTPKKRQEMSEVAKRIGRLLEYESAGTVEFVVDVTDGSFYFLEVNTRLQVEHPITEEVTGIDIVALQLFVASGGRLDTLPVLDNVPQDGCAIECRLCAEDPHNDFFPEHGIVRLWQPASDSTPNLQNTRFETAIETGSRVSIHFDSMIAKIVVWAPTRSMAIQKMVKTLSQTVCAGVKTNQLFLQSCLLHEAFQDSAYTTSFIPNNLPALLKSPYATPANDLKESMAVIPALFMRNVARYLPKQNSAKPFQKVRRGFRNQRFDPVGFQTDVVVLGNSKSERDALICAWKPAPYGPDNRIGATSRFLSFPELSQNGETKSSAAQVTLQYNEISNMIRSGELLQGNTHVLVIESCKATIVDANSNNPWIHAALSVSVNDKVLRVHVATEDYNSAAHCVTSMGKGRRIFCHYPLLGTFEEYHCYNLLSFCESIRESVARETGAHLKHAVAPMPCKVLSVLKKNGDVVKPGETVMIIESMKMEMAISLPQGGKFEAYVQKGDSTNEGTVLCCVV
jgi:acetyl/propionyl-CoA carboxylase alpha subunit